MPQDEPSQDEVMRARQAVWRSTGDEARPATAEPRVEPSQDEVIRARQAVWRSTADEARPATPAPQRSRRSRRSSSGSGSPALTWLAIGLSLLALLSSAATFYRQQKAGLRIDRYHTEIMNLQARLGAPEVKDAPPPAFNAAARP